LVLDPRNPWTIYMLGGAAVRRGVWVAGAIAVLIAAYCGTWWYLSERSRETITAWVAELSRDRVTFTLGEMRRGGFPFAVRWTLDESDAEVRWAAGKAGGRASVLSLWVELWSPKTVRFSADALGLEARHDPTGRAWRLSAKTVSGRLYGTAFGGFETIYDTGSVEIDEVGFENTRTLVRPVAKALGMDWALRGPVIADGGPGHEARFALRGLGVPVVQELIDDGTGSLEARLTLRGSIGDASIEDLVEWRDADGVLEVEGLAIDWPPVVVTFDGTLALDEQLRLLGAGTADIRGMSEVLDKLVERGVVKSAEATVAKLALALLTRPAKDGGGAVVRLPLTAQDGMLRGGPFVLGRLPPIIR
jgi:hypothetical protein